MSLVYYKELASYGYCQRSSHIENLNDILDNDFIQRTCIEITDTDIEITLWGRKYELSHIIPDKISWWDKNVRKLGVRKPIKIMRKYILQLYKNTCGCNSDSYVNICMKLLDNFLQENKKITKIKFKLDRNDSFDDLKINQLLHNNPQINEIEIASGCYFYNIFDIANNCKFIILNPDLQELTEALLLKSNCSIHLKHHNYGIYCDEKITNNLQNAFNETKIVTHLTFKNDIYDWYHRQKIIQCFLGGQNKSIVYLSFSMNKLDNNICDLVQTYILQNPNIEEIHTKNLCNGDVTMKLFKQILSKSKTIRKLSFDHVPNELSCKEIIQVLQKNCLVEEINISKLEEEPNKKCKLVDEINHIKELKIKHTKTYLIQYGSHLINPMIQIINEYVGLSL